MNKLKNKIKALEKYTGREYYKKRMRFILWARSERYKMKDIGEVLGITKQGVKMAMNRAQKISTVSRNK